MKIIRPLNVLLFGLLLSACSFSLAEDLIPPPGSEQLAAPPTQLQATPELLYPIVAPDLTEGQEIYVEKCAPCHGDKGLGNGPRASQLTVPVSRIGDPQVADQATPAEWFNIVTQGNLERFMPPFPSLSDRQKWDVVAYAFSLSDPPQVVAQGRTLYAQNCARCHGAGGKGDGPEAEGALPAFTDQAFMAERSAMEIYTAITTGVAPGMPAYEETLSEAERWTLTAFLRSLTFTRPPMVAESAPYPYPEPVAEAQAAVPGQAYPPPADDPPAAYPAPADQATPGLADELGTVVVEVVNGSGEAIPLGSELEITLYGFDNMQLVYTETLSSAAGSTGGVYTFDNVQMPAGRAFLAGVDYAGGTFGSDVAVVDLPGSELKVPVTVYATTTDQSKLSIDRAHIFFDFIDSENLQVVELYVISNPTDRMVIAAEEGGPVVSFSLPPEATNLEFQDGALGERYLQTPDGFADTLAVRPGVGEYQVLFAYQLSYHRKLDFSRNYNLPVNAAIVFVPEEGVKLRSSQLQDQGVRDMQEISYRMYSTESLPVDSQLMMNLSGSPKIGGPTLSTGGLAGDSRASLAIGLGFFGLALVITGVWLYQRSGDRLLISSNWLGQILPAGLRERLALPNDRDELPQGQQAENGALGSPPSLQDPETVMDAIIALDDLYQAGELPEEAYQARRAELKSQLQALHPGSPYPGDPSS